MRSVAGILAAMLLTFSTVHAASNDDFVCKVNVTLKVDDKNRMFWNGILVPSEAALASRFDAASKQSPRPCIHLLIDQQAKYDFITQIMRIARATGQTRMGFVGVMQAPTDPRAVQKPATPPH